MIQLVSPSTSHTTHAIDRPFLAADVGGTHARIGLVRRGNGRPQVLAYTSYVGADHDGLVEILEHFLRHHVEGECITHMVLACAGYPIDGRVINDNLPWPVDVGRTRQALHLDELSLINDFEAVAHAARHIDPRHTTLLSACDSGSEDGPVVVVGPGTGLGSAVFVPHLPHALVLPSEAGQIDLAPGNPLESEIRDRLAREDAYVSYEHVLSGPGLLNLHRILGERTGNHVVLDDPAAVTRRALGGDDPVAHQALDTFCAVLGSFVGNLAMLYGASGGVYLAGGIVPHIREFLQHSRFIERFLAKGRMRAFLERVPVRLTEHGQLGVIGAAGWYLQQSEAAS